MIVIKKSRIGSKMKFFVGGILFGLLMILLEILTGGSIIAASPVAAYYCQIVILALGVYGVIKMRGIKSKYEKFFEENDEKTLDEIASETGNSKKKVISDLGQLVALKEVKNIKNCESIKFSA